MTLEQATAMLMDRRSQGPGRAAQAAAAKKAPAKKAATKKTAAKKTARESAARRTDQITRFVLPPASLTLSKSRQLADKGQRDHSSHAMASRPANRRGRTSPLRRVPYRVAASPA